MSGQAQNYWCSGPSNFKRTTSRASTDSDFSISGPGCFASHPAVNPLENTYSGLSRKSSSWRIDPILAIPSNFAPHPAVRPLQSWQTDLSTTDEDEKTIKEDETAYPKPFPLFLIVLGLCLAVFIISLDRSIVTTAIPSITADFDSINDIGWYGSSYMLTASAFQPLYGRIYTSFSVKSTFLASLVIFEVGSLVCGIAPTSDSLIIGRSIQGLGSAGILTGGFVILTHTVRLQLRPLFFAGIGILYGAGALCGPLIGGVFTDLVSWRWCFYVNLPCGGLTLATVFLLFHPKEPPAATSFLSRVLKLDLIGNVILLGASIMLFLALQFTEQGHSWTSADVVGLLVGAFLTTVVFICWLLYRGEEALIPPRIVRQRTVISSCLVAFFLYGALCMHSYFLPIWFQAVKGASAIHSGVNMIPYMAANAIFSLIAGILVSKNGLFAAPAIVGSAIGTIGAGLMCTLQVNTSSSKWIGYEILTSVGLGMAIQQGFTAVQTVLPLKDVPIGTAAVVGCQSLGGAVFISVGNTVLQNTLLHGRLWGVNILAILEDGATGFRNEISPAALPMVLKWYNHGLRNVFYGATALVGLSFLAALGMEWNRNLIKKEPETRVENFDDSVAKADDK